MLPRLVTIIIPLRNYKIINVTSLLAAVRIKLGLLAQVCLHNLPYTIPMSIESRF